MSSNISRRILGSFLVLIAGSWSAGAEKITRPSAVLIAARKDVEAALRAEAAGDNDRRAELLASASRAASDLPEANWHLGRVQIANKWLTLDEAEQQAADDPLLAEYRKLRDEAGENPKLLRGLARWCLKNDMHE